MEEGKRKLPRRSSRIHSDGGTSNQKVYRRSQMRVKFHLLLLRMKLMTVPILVWESHKYRVSKTRVSRTRRSITKVKNELKR
ncbi:hypothetical protein RDI58_013059 [Solanum bulbocastanum]|uniref:Uncharacterized protein n=1 Tax=Solanum bulbocastanum TaxID=147425 RepID=A0AAN8TK40_SOLBU